MTRFRSKIDAWVRILLLLTIAVQLSVLLEILRADYSAATRGITLLAVGLGILLVASILLRTYYTVDSEHLAVVSGPFRWSIPIAAITEVTDSKSLISSPALSLDRMRISYGQNKHLLISPKDKTGFLRAIGKHAT